jgi:bidirectional [NiFe] hydrogenase diaphorase subunit
MQTALPKNQTNSHPSGDKRFKVLDVTMKRNQYSQDSLIEILHKAQACFGYLEEDVLIYVARQLKLPLSRVYGVATFYHLFSLKPTGKHTCVVCMGTACYVKGGNALLETLKQEFNLSPGLTTPDGEISLATARCIGACGIAPAAVFDGQVNGKQTPETLIAKIKAWENIPVNS